MAVKFPDFFGDFERTNRGFEIADPALDGMDYDGTLSPNVPPPGYPAPWADGFPPEFESDAPTWRTTISQDAEGGDHLVGRLPDPPASPPRGSNGRTRPMTADIVAVYRPWHFWREDWGIYVNAIGLAAYADRIAHEANIPRPLIEPLAYRQVLRHELVHFAFEVAATEMEDLLQRPLYVSYVRRRFGAPNPTNVAPLEEAVATFAELEYAGGTTPRSVFKPPGYKASVRRALMTNALPGYKDFAICGEGNLHNIVREVSSLIADQPIHTGRWNMTATAETNQVPTYWVGDKDGAISVGAIPKQAGPPSIKRFEKWVRKIGGRKDNAGKGDHRTAYLPDRSGMQKAITYDPGHGFLLRPEADEVKRLYGIRGLQALYLMIARLESPVS
jgi:hypothetical protein